MPPKTSHVCKLSPEQADRLREILEIKGWEIDQVPHSRWRARDAQTTTVAYQSGKFVAQGKGTAEFVQFVLEPQILGEARFGYEGELAAAENPRMFEPHAGIDESGKGDYFGPLVIAVVHVDATSARRLVEVGVVDSKTIKSDRRITALACEIRNLVGGAFAIVSIGPEAYNRLQTKMGTVNRVLAWGHARGLENLLEKQADCPRAISDQFGRVETVRQALLERGRAIVLEQYPKAEADIAVAAASILARHEFVTRLERLAQAYDLPLPKGASEAVIKAGRAFVAKHGYAALGQVAKLHFRTTDKVLAGCPI